LEVYGDAERIRGIVEGEKDAVREFLAGGLRVRGDLRYLSELGLELGFLRRPPLSLAFNFRRPSF
jgi:hypothetical protein